MVEGEDIRRKVLLIAYHFPPIRISSGLQRTLSLARYLRENGWQPTVLSIAPRAYEIVSDDQLADIPREVQVVRAAGWDTARHFSVRRSHFKTMALPDRWVSWLPAALWHGWRIVRREQPDLIWSTYPIATAHLVGLLLHRITGVPWITDFRDAMTESEFPADPRQRRLWRWIETRAITRAAKVVFTAPGTLDMYRNRYPDERGNKFAIVSNGFDEEIFSRPMRMSLNAAERGLKQGMRNITLVHSGVLYPTERDPTQFFKALAQLKQDQHPAIVNLSIRLRATGSDALYQPMLARYDIEDIVTLEPGIGYREALAEMLQADGLLLFQAAMCNHQIPAKLYEYFRAQRPIFAMTDAHGDTAETLRQASIRSIVPLDDADSIARGLTQFLSNLESEGQNIAPEAVTDTYSRRSLVQDYAALFEEVRNCSH